MSKIVRLTESELVRLVKRMIKESEEGFERIDDDNFDDMSDEDDVEDYGLDYDEEDDYDDESQKEILFKDFMRKNKQSPIGIGGGTRWDSESEKEWSPIKPTDMPLDKFLKSKYNNR